MSTGYILVGLRLEERDLIAAHPEYAEYMKRVPGLMPFGKRRSQERASVASRSA
jgi:protein-S-isoprenylcysteine O-methyltransferase Ste14